MVAERPDVAAGASRPPSIELACPPRFGTQRNPSRPTLGPAVGVIARRLGMPLMPWQQHVADVALELDPDGSFHYDEVILSLPRQNGKSALVLAWIVHRLIVAPIAMGRQRVTYTAQLRQKARAKLEKDWAEVLRQAPPVDGVASFPEILNPKARPQQPSEWKLSLNNGSENIQFGRGNFLQLDAPSRTGGHGDTLDVGVIDEAWVHENNTVETGMSPSMATRANRQFLIVSAAGEARSKYFYRKVLAGRRACVAARPGRTAYFEWSALALDWDPEKPDRMEMIGEPGDPATWRACMPALDITITERFVEGEWAKAVRDGREGIELFCRSYLNMWMEVPVLEEITKGSDLPVDAWLALADPGAERGTDVVFGVDIGTDRIAHVAVAWRRPDGGVQVMLADKVSPLRTAARLRELQAKWGGPVMLGGTSAPLEGEVDDPVVMSAKEFAAAVGMFEDLITDQAIHHGNQAELNEAVEHSDLRPYGATGAQTLQLRDAPTAPPLAAVLRALHGVTSGLGAAPPSPIVVRQSATSRTVGSEPNIATMEF